MPGFFDPAAVIVILPGLLPALGMTVTMVLPAIVAGTLLGLFLAMARLYRVPVLAQFAALFVSLFRGTPFLVQLFLAYFAAPAILYAMGLDVRRAPPVYFAIAAFALNQAVFLSEIFRAAIGAVKPGQIYAARAVGMSEWQVNLRIVWPQAALIALPGWGNSLVILFQETSLAFTIGVIEVMGAAHAHAVRTFQSLESYAAAAIIFIVISLLLEGAFALIARRLGLAVSHARTPGV